uniref:Uncharacterized protein n=2 Tax=environmental samples TaxID=129696 RepID=E7C556_9HYPH|nr:hypothetical protein [uncultured Rhizobium sp. HF0130_09F11]ADI22580.1 hypothetical protein [uncultured Rhizobium sp. HF0500_10F10]
MIVVVGAHVGDRGDAVGHGEKRRHRGDVENAPVGIARVAQHLPVGLDDGVRALGQLDDEIQHRGALVVEPGGPPVLGNRLAEAGIAGELACGGAMGGQAIMAVIDRGNDDGDDLAVQLRSGATQAKISGGERP